MTRRGGAECVPPADRDQATEAEVAHCLADALGAVLRLQRIGPRGPEDCPASRQDAARRFHRQLLVEALERTFPPVTKANQRVSVDVDALAHDRPDRRVKTRAVA